MPHHGAGRSCSSRTAGRCRFDVATDGRRARRPARRRAAWCPGIGPARRRHRRHLDRGRDRPTPTARRPRRGVVEAEGFRVRLLALDPETYRLAYDVVSNETLWFAHHGLCDLAHEPTFDAHVARRLGRLPRRERAPSPTPWPRSPPRAPRCWCRTTTSACGRAPRRAAARPARACTSATRPFAPPAWLARAPRRRGRRSCSHGHGRPRRLRLPHRRGGRDDFAASAAALAGLEPTTFVSPLAPDPDDIRAVGGVARSARRPWRALDAARRRPRAHRPRRPHRAVEEHPARLPRLRRPARASTRSTGNGSCSSPASTRPGRACPSTPPTGEVHRASRRRGQRAVGHADAGRRSCSTSTTTTRVGRPAAAGRRAARQPHPRRAQPRRQGGGARERARRRARPLARGGRVGAAAGPAAAAGATVRRGRHRRRAPPGPDHARRRADPTGATPPRTWPRPAHRGTGWPTSWPPPTEACAAATGPRPRYRSVPATGPGAVGARRPDPGRSDRRGRPAPGRPHWRRPRSSRRCAPPPGTGRARRTPAGHRRRRR